MFYSYADIYNIIIKKNLLRNNSNNNKNNNIKFQPYPYHARPGNKFTTIWLMGDYRLWLHASKLQPIIKIEDGFLGLAHSPVIMTLFQLLDDENPLWPYSSCWMMKIPANLGNDEGFIIKEYPLHWFWGLFVEDQNKTTRVCVQSGLIPLWRVVFV